MLGAIALILACQLAGEISVHILNLPIPGPVLGMVFLFGYLCLRGHISEGTDKVTGNLLSHMSLLFVPAGVGVIRYTYQIEDEATAIVASVVGGTIVTIAIVAWLAQRLLPKQHHEESSS